MAMTLEELIRGFMELSTPCVSDALDTMRIRCGCEGLMPIIQGKKFVGPAFTVEYGPIGQVKTGAGDYIDEANPGDVIVISNGAKTFCTAWGGLLSTVAKEKGVVGTVIDGVCRDVDVIRDIDYPMYTKGHYMVTGKDRIQMLSYQKPITFCDIQVHPGDLVMADQSGVLIIPINVAEEVLLSARKIDQAESLIEKAVKEGHSLKEARVKYKYDSLQRAKA